MRDVSSARVSAASGRARSPRRRVDPGQGRRAVQEWLRDGAAAPRATLAIAVRWSLEELSARAPGNSVEVRVPPFGVTQCLAGPRHTRGTPPNVVETDAECWLRLVTGQASWDGEVAAGRVRASGQRAVLTGLLPLPGFGPGEEPQVGEVPSGT